MLAQPAGDAAATTPAAEAPTAKPTADRISLRGRALTTVMFGIVVALLLFMFLWFGASRIN